MNPQDPIQKLHLYKSKAIFSNMILKKLLPH